MATQLDIASLQRQIKGMAMGIEKYTGHSASVPINDWLEDFELLALDQGRQTNEEKARFLAFHLAGDAKVFYHGLSQQEKADYNTLKQKLQENFLPMASDIQAAKLAFYTRKQGPYESLRDFVHQAEIAARQLGLTPADQVNAVISNCRPAIRRLLRALTFASLKELSKSLIQEDFEEELNHPTLQAIMDMLDTFQQTQERPQTVKFAVAATDVLQQRDYRQSRHHNREYPQQRERSRLRPKYDPKDDNIVVVTKFINHLPVVTTTISVLGAT